ncbi:MAG: hypothetical protein LJE84_13005 [Gammaproteobacteria bacterium]|nr:hypothetical protein [Gammaproteobacteria bacterium]
MRSHLIIGVFLACTLITAGPVRAAGDADQLFQAKKWQEAATAYQAIVQAEPKNAQARERLATSQFRLEQWQAALSNFGEVEKLGGGSPVVYARAGIAAAKLKQEKNTLRWARLAAEAGFPPGFFSNQEAFAWLKDNADFQAVIATAEQKAFPCRSGAVWRQFDFWLGEWKVSTPDGRHAGDNRIEKSLEGCLLIENWTSQSGSSGKSVNYYDPALKKWVQVWIDAGGGVIRAEGGLEDGAMKLYGHRHTVEGEKLAYRMTFTPEKDGSVHQLLEESPDDGKTWELSFDGIYRHPEAEKK